MLRQALFTIGVLILLFAITWLTTYYVFRAAIRDGIRESGLLEALKGRVRAGAVTTSTEHDLTPLPPMQGDRRDSRL